MTTITLHDALGEQVGQQVWKLLVSSVSEALRAIEANTGKLYGYLGETGKFVEYRIIVNGADFEQESDLIIGKDIRTIDIVPIPSGSAGLWKVIIGAVLLIIAVVLMFVPGAQPVAAWLGTTAVGLIFSIGLSLVLGGISEMMSKAPKQSTNPLLNRGVGESGLAEPDNKRPSYLFSGVVNTTRQGNCVPLGYGRLIVGSQLISFGVSASPIVGSFGGSLPPDASDPFLTLGFWAVYEADSRAQYVASLSQVKRYSSADTRNKAPYLSLTTNGHGNATIAQLKAQMNACVYLFTGPHNSLTFKQAVSLYNWLGLTEITVPKTATWIDYVTALTHFYLPSTPVI